MGPPLDRRNLRSRLNGEALAPKITAIMQSAVLQLGERIKLAKGRLCKKEEFRSKVICDKTLRIN